MGHLPENSRHVLYHGVTMPAKKIMPSARTHEEKETLEVDIEVPGHAPRTTTGLFRRTKQRIMAVASILGLNIFREKGRCWICGKTSEEAGEPLEAHHLIIERSFIDSPLRWDQLRKDFPHFDWENFDPTKPEMFVDDMITQGLLLCKEHHTGKDTGIHTLPFPLWVLQRYLPDGVQFSPTEVIHHDEV